MTTRQNRTGQRMIRRSDTSWRIVRPTEHRFAKGHKFFAPYSKAPPAADKAAVAAIKRRLRREYGPDLSASQRAYIDSAARARHQLEKMNAKADRGEEIDIVQFGTLANIERRSLRALYGMP
jgi:hypothetical protein